jgi:competence protein ComEA
MGKTFLLALVCVIGSVGALSAGQAVKADAAKAKPAIVKEELRVDLNHADAAELAKLPGIGEQVAKRIIAYRNDNGPFEKTEELMNVRGIGEKTYLKLRPMLTLGSGKEPRKK